MPLVLGRVAAFAFIVVQWVAVARIGAELVPQIPMVQALVATGWLVAFVPWLGRSVRLYGTPRVGGNPG
jgi:uncharacterized protein involved in response to NO